MKKIILPMIGAALLTTGCASSSLHKSSESLAAQGAVIETRPLEASVIVGEKIKGSAQCESILGFNIKSPNKMTVGATIGAPSGMSSGACTNGAIYDAVSRSNADLIVSPQYEIENASLLCIPVVNACFRRTTNVVVTGYKGTYTSIKEMSADVIKTRQTSPEFSAK